MMVLLAAWMVCIIVFLGIGLLIRAAIVGRRAPTGIASFACAWCGFAICVGILQVWHLFLPVNGVATGALIFAGLCGIGSSRCAVRQFMRDVAREGKLTIAFVLFAVWTADRGLAHGGYDDLGYEWHSVHWIGTYPIVPGIGNLNQRFGFNNAHHLLAACMNLGPLEGRVHHALLGVFVLLVAAQVLWGFGRFLKGGVLERGPLLTMTFAAPCLLMLLFGMFGPMFSTLKADILVTAAAFAAVSLLANLPSRTPMERARASVADDSDFVLFTVVVLAAAMVTVKLSSLVLSIGLMIAAILCGLYINNINSNRVRVAAFAVASLLVATWLMRGGVISGYPLYPSRAITMPVSWRVTPDVPDRELAFITSCGRGATNPTRDADLLASRPWFVHWLSQIVVNDKFTTVLPTALLLSAVPFAIHTGRRCPDRTSSSTLGIIVAMSVASILFWIISAPTPRFGYVFFWTAAGATLAMAWPCGTTPDSLRKHVAIAVGGGVLLIVVAVFAAILPLHPGTRLGFLAFGGVGCFFVPLLCFWVSIGAKKSVLTGMCLLGVSPLLERGVAHALKGRMPELARFLLVAPGSDAGFHPYPSPFPGQSGAFVTISGLKLVTRANLYYESPLLAVEPDYDNVFVRLRYHGDISRGFEDVRIRSGHPARGRALRSLPATGYPADREPGAMASER
jgi:hypothetical protein